MKFTFLILLLTCIIPAVHAQSQIINISKSDLNTKGVVNLSNYLWRYHTGDNREWADPNYDDINWEPAYTKMQSGGMLDTHWSGIGWFRLRIEIDSSLTNIPIGFHIHQNGASQIYLNGRLIKQIGKVSPYKKYERPKVNIPPFFVQLKPGKVYLLAIRYSNHQFRNFISSNYFDQADIYKGFTLSIGNFNTMYAHLLHTHTYYYFFMILLLGIILALSFSHMVRFFNKTGQKSNFYFALALSCLAIIIFSAVFFKIAHNLNLNIIVQIANFISIIALGIISLRFTYSFTERKPPLYFLFLVVIGIVLAGCSVFFDIRMRFLIDLFLAINILESLRIVILYFYRNGQGSRIIISGIITTFILTGIQLLMNFQILNLSWRVHGNLLAYYSILGVVVSISVYLTSEMRNRNKIYNPQKREKE